MKIRRQRLLELVTAEQTRLREGVADRIRVENATNRRRREEYERKLREAWEIFSDQVNRLTAAREPITFDDVPAELRSFRDGLKFWQEPRSTVVTDIESTLEYRRLDALRRMLEATEDEVISTYALERAGFRLENLMRASAQLT